MAQVSERLGIDPVIPMAGTQQVEEVVAGPGGGTDAIAQGGTGARIFVVTSTCDPDRLAGTVAVKILVGTHVETVTLRISP